MSTNAYQVSREGARKFVLSQDTLAHSDRSLQSNRRTGPMKEIEMCTNRMRCMQKVQNSKALVISFRREKRKEVMCKASTHNLSFQHTCKVIEPQKDLSHRCAGYHCFPYKRVSKVVE